MVYRCRIEGVQASDAAVKLLYRTSARSDQLRTLAHEARLCRHLHHLRLVTFIHASINLLIGDERCVAIVMEWMPHFLDELVSIRAKSSPPRPLTPPFLTEVALQLADALVYLHDGLSPPLLRRDVKPGMTHAQTLTPLTP